MALATTEHEVNPFPRDKTSADIELPPPPDIAITPCDPWPRPYYFENGLRRVAPYHFTYNTFCKQRWRGRGLLDIFSAEFRDRDREYYKKAIEEGQIVINGKPAEDVNAEIKNGDVVSHTLHRHEPPVTAQPIKVIAETNEMIVIDKPAGVPVHPAGRYNYNSVVEIIRAERHHSFNPLPCNRLDRLTSGVMFIAKISSEAESISQSLRERTVRKEYVARVTGRFPDGEGWDGDFMRGGVIKCDEPILQISPVLGLNRARASGKSAKTLFRRIAYYPGSRSSTQPPTLQEVKDPTTGKAVALPAMPDDGAEDDGYSIVHCLPLTGRTHQIRVHLQFLGHPISNDPIYSNRRVFGPSLGKHDSTGENDKEVMERLSRMGKTETAETADSRAKQPDVSTLTEKAQQMTVRDTQEKLKREQDALKDTAEAPLYHLPANYKPLNSGTLHAGSLGSATENGGEASEVAEYDAFVKAHDEMVKDYNKRKGEKLTGEVCSVCQTPLYSDPGPQELGIYLHALAYADLDGKWKYRSTMPEWGKPPIGMEGPDSPGEWIYEGAGAEGLEIGDEKEREMQLNAKGMRKNKDETT